MLVSNYLLSQGEQRYADGTSTDQNQNTFEWINYGTQDWTIENAEVTHYRDGTPIPQVTDDTEWANLTTGAWCYYNNDPTKGKLYNWYAVMGIHDNDENTPNKEFAPDGWRVPSDEDWTTLENYLISNGYNYDGTTTGNKIAKSLSSTSGWDSSTSDGVPGNNQLDNNFSGFNSLPQGSREEYGILKNEGKFSVFWSSTMVDSNKSHMRYLDANNIILGKIPSNKYYGYSVRFVRDLNEGDILLKGTVSAEDNQIKNVADPTHSQDVTTKKYVDSKTSEISNSQNFSNNSQIGLTGVVYDFEGNRYETVIMCDGKQWTTQYLNVSHFANGEQIPEVTDNEAWRDLTTPAWCYSYNQDNGRGKIYNGFALTDERGLAPEGWHIATEEEWNDLIECLGGTEVAGGKLKISGTQYWTSPNVGSGATGKASNSSGMSLLPDGFREGANGNFYSENEFVSIWNYSNIPDRRPYVHLLNDKAEISKGLTDPYDGAHILLVKD